MLIAAPVRTRQMCSTPSHPESNLGRCYTSNFSCNLQEKLQEKLQNIMLPAAPYLAMLLSLHYSTFPATISEILLNKKEK